MVGVASTAGKLAFDSIVQRDAPDANRGRSFAKFETRFQIIWVVGALLGLIAFSPRVGFLIVSLGAGFAAFSYGIGSLAWRHRSGAQRTRATETAVVIDDRITEVQAAAKRGLRRPAARMRERMAEQWARRRGRAAPRRGRGAEPDIDGPVRWADDPASDTLPFDDPDPFGDLPSFGDPPPPPPPPDPVEPRPPPPPPGWRVASPIASDRSEPSPHASVRGRVSRRGGRCGPARGPGRRPRPASAGARSERHSRSRPSSPARSTTPSMNAAPRS